MANRVERQDEVTTARLEMLTDGIFAIVMTILVLELRLPEIEPGHSIDLQRVIFELVPSFLSLIVSFIILGNYWVAHHTEFRFIKRMDHTLIWLNILFLLFISLIPFSASVIGRFYIEPLAVVLYGSNLFLAGFVHYLMWNYASGKYRLIDRETSPTIIRFGNLLSVFALIPYLFAIGFAFIDTRISVVIYALVPIPYILGIYYRFLGK